MGLDTVFLPLEIQSENIESAVNSLEALDFVECNVTIPHKQTVLPLMDELDETASDCGAVNTIVFRDGRRVGYNTDGTGFVWAMKEKAGFDPAGKRCLVIGAGGAARGVTAALARAGTSFFTILNRQEESEMAKSLSCDMNKRKPGIAKAGVLSHSEVAEGLKYADFVLHATSLGTSPNVDGVAFDTSLLESRHAVFDVVYNPRETRLLKEAQSRGCVTLSGFWMLVYQAAESIKIWTGKNPPIDVMAEAAERFLSTRH